MGKGGVRAGGGGKGRKVQGGGEGNGRGGVSPPN